MLKSPTHIRSVSDSASLFSQHQFSCTQISSGAFIRLSAPHFNDHDTLRQIISKLRKVRECHINTPLAKIGNTEGTRRMRTSADLLGTRLEIKLLLIFEIWIHSISFIGFAIVVFQVELELAERLENQKWNSSESEESYTLEVCGSTLP